MWLYSLLLMRVVSSIPQQLILLSWKVADCSLVDNLIAKKLILPTFQPDAPVLWGNVCMISFFAIKLSTREQSATYFATFHDHRGNWELIWFYSAGKCCKLRISIPHPKWEREHAVISPKCEEEFIRKTRMEMCGLQLKLSFIQDSYWYLPRGLVSHLAIVFQPLSTLVSLHTVEFMGGW